MRKHPKRSRKTPDGPLPVSGQLIFQQTHHFVGSEFPRFPWRQIRHLRVTSNQGFWADHEAGPILTARMRIKAVLLRPLAISHLASIISPGWVEFKGLWYTLGRGVSPDEFAARSFSGASFNRVRTRERISSGALVRYPVPAIHRKKEVYLTRHSPHQNMWFDAGWNLVSDSADSSKESPA